MSLYFRGRRNPVLTAGLETRSTVRISDRNLWTTSRHFSRIRVALNGRHQAFPQLHQLPLPTPSPPRLILHSVMMKLGHHGNGDRRLSLSSKIRLPPTVTTTMLINQRAAKVQTRTEQMATVVTRQVGLSTNVYAYFGILAYLPSSGGTRAGQWSVISRETRSQHFGCHS